MRIKVIEMLPALPHQNPMITRRFKMRGNRFMFVLIYLIWKFNASLTNIIRLLEKGRWHKMEYHSSLWIKQISL